MFWLLDFITQNYTETLSSHFTTQHNIIDVAINTNLSTYINSINPKMTHHTTHKIYTHSTSYHIKNKEKFWENNSLYI